MGKEGMQKGREGEREEKQMTMIRTTRKGHSLADSWRRELAPNAFN